MARLYPDLDSSRKSGKRSALRLILLATFLILLIFTGSYMLYTPLKQIYWGTAGRIRLSSFKSRGSDPNSGAAAADDAPPDLTKTINVVTTEPAAVKDEAPADKPAEESTIKKVDQDSLSFKHRLTKEMAEDASKTPDGKRVPVVVTWANFHYKDFVINWVEHLQATGCKNLLVGAMDEELLKVLLAAKVPCFGMASGLTLGDFGWGSESFKKMGYEKISLIQTFTRWGVDVIISDVDTVWMKNPIEYMLKYPEADVLTSSDLLTPTKTDGGLETPWAAHAAANIGIMLFRPTGAELADEWVKILEKDETLWDQNVFNELMHRGLKADLSQIDSPENRQDRLFIGYDGKLKFGVLPVSTFCSGHTFYVQRLPEVAGLEPYVVHNTFQFSGTVGKRFRFREFLLWNDPPEYFDHPKGFIATTEVVPAKLKTAVEMVTRDGSIESTLPHFHLVNHQLVTLRALFAVSTLLGRATIFPELWCGFDRWWAPHSGHTGGSNFPLPYRCPADHVLDLEGMNAGLSYPVQEFGPPIEYREYSFLENPRAAKLKSTKVLVRTCGNLGEQPQPPAGQDCHDGSKPAKVVDGVIWLQPSMDETQITAALGDIAKDTAAVLDFENISGLWAGFKNPAAAEQFKKRIDMYGSIWCCVDRHPGHVFYDFFWDIPSHKDRFNRDIEVWEPLTGP